MEHQWVGLIALAGMAAEYIHEVRAPTTVSLPHDAAPSERAA
jgi:hypothetical protein